MILPLQAELRSCSDPERARAMSGFFKTGPGEYGEGDIFLGVSVPDTRTIMKKYLSESDFSSVEILLASPYHEERLAGALILVAWAKKKTYPIAIIADFYDHHREQINNWDLVDTSARDIVGAYLFGVLSEKERNLSIERYIASDHLWTQRMIVVATFYPIKNGVSAPVFSIVPRFFTHPHDLMHKACGWMLREAGKRVSERELCNFLDQHAQEMPRTMLRYAIERLDMTLRKRYMNTR